MASVKLNHVYKIYPSGAKAVKDFSMSIEDKEFIVFVGPSGCGKSTTLRMIAGLEDISAGEIYIDGHLVNDVEPKDRDIAMVFQNYALYPHISVYENMAFGLKIRKLPNEEIHRRVLEAAEILGITEYLDQKPRAMSGGQRQRVALGRAIVREPKVFLFDEPLSNLDAKLRTQMRAEIRKLHAKLNTTFIYVTHDQTEAMTMGTRIVVMRDGRVQQIDTPKNLYEHPTNRFVAGFIGSPPMNFYRARLDAKGGIHLLHTEAILPCPESRLCKMYPDVRAGRRECIMGIRAEKIHPDNEAGKAVATCTVTHAEELGDETLVYGDLSDEALTVTEHGTEVVFRIGHGVKTPIAGERMSVSFDLDGAHFFDVITGENVCPVIPEKNVISVSVQDRNCRWGGVQLPLPPAISLPDGEYTAEIPITAVLPGRRGNLLVANREAHGERLLTHLKQSDSILFAAGAIGQQGSTCGIDLDYRRIDWRRGEETVLTALQETCSLPARVTRRRREGRWEFYLTVCDAELPLPDDVLSGLVKSVGTSILKRKLRCEIPPDALTVSDRGIQARVDRYLDYGTHKYLEVEASGAMLLVEAQAEVKGHVCLSPSLSRITYVDAEAGAVLYN